MALSYDASVKAALDAALPGQKLTDADYHWWTNNGGAAAVQNTWGAPAPAPAPAPASNGFVVGGGGSSSGASPAPAAPSPVAPMRDVPGGYQVTTNNGTINTGVSNKAWTPDMSNARVASFWGNVNPANPDGTNVLGGNMSQGVVQSLGFKTAQEYLDWDAENKRKAAMGDPNGFVTGGGRAPGAGTGGAGGSGSSSGGIIGSNTGANAGFTPWNVTAPQTVQSQAAGIIAADSPLMQQARGRAMQQMNERGLINSSLAAQAAQDAVMDRAIQIGSQDASTNASSAQFNANQQNAWNLAQQQMEYQRWALMQNFENQKQLQEVESKYSAQLNSDANFQKQYAMYLDALFQIDMNTALDEQTKLAMKRQRAQELDDYVAINKLGINMDFSDYWASKQTSAPAPAPAPAAGGSSSGGSMFTDQP